MKRFLALALILLVSAMALAGCGAIKSDTVGYSVATLDQKDNNSSASYKNESYPQTEQHNSTFLRTLRPEIDLIAKSVDEAHGSIGITLLCRHNYGDLELVPVVKLHEANFAHKDTDEIVQEIDESDVVWRLSPPEDTLEIKGIIATWTSYDSFGDCFGYSTLDFDGDGRWDVVSDSDLNTKVSFLSATDTPLVTYENGSTLTIPKSITLVDVPPEAISFSDMERLI